MLLFFLAALHIHICTVHLPPVKNKLDFMCYFHFLASEKMANRESAVLTSYDTLLSPPTASEGRPTSVSSTVSSSSLRTNGTVSPSLTPSAKPRATRRRTIIFGTVSLYFCLLLYYAHILYQ